MNGTLTWCCESLNVFSFSTVLEHVHVLEHRNSITKYISTEMHIHIHQKKCFVVVVQSLSRVWLFATPRTVAHHSPLSPTISQSLLKFMSMELVMLSNHLILCHPLLFLPSVFSSIKNVYHTTICNGHKLEATQMCISKRTYAEIVVSTSIIYEK